MVVGVGVVVIEVVVVMVVEVVSNKAIFLSIYQGIFLSRLHIFSHVHFILLESKH